MLALDQALHSDSPRVVQNALWTLRNLSDAAVRECGLESLLQTLVGFLSNNDISILQCAAGILSNLTCNNPENKRIVCASRGVRSLVDLISRGGIEREDLVEPAVCALRHLTSRHEDAETARTDIIGCNALPLLVQLISAARLPVQKATIGLLRNLALSEVSQDVIRKENVINLLGGMLHDLQNELVEAGSRMVDGVSLEEIVEGVLGTLHILARFPCKNLKKMKQFFKKKYRFFSYFCSANHKLINRANVVPTTIKVLNRMNNQNIQRAAVGLLCEVAVDPEIASQIDGENGAIFGFTKIEFLSFQRFKNFIKNVHAPVSKSSTL